MNTFPSSTYFSAPPDWGWLIVFYFFFGGLAGGCYFLAVLIDLLDRPELRYGRVGPGDTGKGEDVVGDCWHLRFLLCYGVHGIELTAPVGAIAYYS